MRKQLQLGLVVEGNSTDSAILRLPKIAEELGPIKSAALRVARRLSNLLKAGYAVAEYEDLQPARLVLLYVPDGAVPRIVDELCRSELVFRDLCFVLCESWLLTDVLEPLKMRGASVATLVQVPTIGRNWFALDGQLTATRQVRRLLETNGARGLELRAGTKPLYFAATLLATVLPIPLFVAAQQALRESGVSGNHLHTLMREMTEAMFRDFSKSARLAWGGPLTECSDETAHEYLEILRRNEPQLAAVIEEQLARVRRRVPKKMPSDGLSTELHDLPAAGQ